MAQRRSFDCGVACVAMFCHVDYMDALYVAQRIAKQELYKGLNVRQVRAIAAELQRPLRVVNYKVVDLDEDAGILGITYNVKPVGGYGHWVVLRHGTIIEPDPAAPRVWDADIYLKTSNARHGALLAEQL